MNDLLKRAALWTSMSLFVIGSVATSSTFNAHAEEEEWEDCILGEDPECQPIPCDQPTGVIDGSALACSTAAGGKGRKPKGARCFLGDNGCEEKGDGCPEEKVCRKGEGTESPGCACRLPKKSPSPSPKTPTPTPKTPTPTPTPKTPTPGATATTYPTPIYTASASPVATSTSYNPYGGYRP